MAVTKTTTKDGLYTLDTYTGSGVYGYWTVPTGVTSVTHFIAAGGGGGGVGLEGSVSVGAGGGGGAGEAIEGSFSVTPGEQIYIAVGAGGTGGLNVSPYHGVKGGNTTLKAITVIGGGYGGAGQNGVYENGGPGGCSGGGGGVSGATAGTPGSGCGDGGDTVGTGTDAFGGCGGGGMYGSGSAGSPNSGINGGAGGAGRQWTYGGSTVYATGGGGGNSITPGNVYLLSSYPVLANGSNQTTALQNALNYASDNGYAKVSFPTGGTIGIDSPIDYPGSMEYIGNGCTIKTLADSDIGHWVWTHDTGTNCYIHHLIFDGNMNYQTVPHPASGYYFPYMPNDGICIRQGGRFEYNEVKNFGGYMVETLKNNGSIIRYNNIHTGWQYGICIAGDNGVWNTNAIVTDNTITNMGQVGIKCVLATGATISGNVITMPAKYDLFTSSSPHNTGSGTPDGSPSPTGIRLYSADDPNNYITITGNTINGTGGNDEIAIDSDDTQNHHITCTNNTLVNVSYGIYNNFPSSTVTGNVITYTNTCMYSTVSGNTCTHI